MNGKRQDIKKRAKTWNKETKDFRVQKRINEVQRKDINDVHEGSTKGKEKTCVYCIKISRTPCPKKVIDLISTGY